MTSPLTCFISMISHKLGPHSHLWFRGKDVSSDSNFLSDFVGGSMNIGGLAMQAFGGAVKGIRVWKSIFDNFTRI